MPTVTLVKPSYREIPLTNSDHFALVDARDYNYLMQWEWQLSRTYTKRPLIVRFYKRRHYYLHKEIAGLYKDHVVSVDHINGNSFDNRRENLRPKVRPPSKYGKNELIGKFSDLTKNQKEVAKLISLGLSNTEIAQRLHKSVRTIESYVGQINSAVGTNNRTEIATLLAENWKRPPKLEYVPLPPLSKKLKAVEQLKNQRLITAQMLIDARDALSIQLNQLQEIYQQIDETLQILKP